MKIVVTRHPALVEYLVEQKIIPGATEFDGGIAYCPACGTDIAHEAHHHTLPTHCPICVRVIAHATRDDVRGQDVIGVLPMSLASYAKTVTEIPMNIPPELRGKELTLSQVREFAGPPETFVVQTLREWNYTACMERTHVDDR